MKKYPLKSLNRGIIFSLIFFLSACSTISHKPTTLTSEKQYSQNSHYQLITPAIAPKITDHRIEVVEVFFYACPHCNELDSKIHDWLKGKEHLIDFKRMPAILGPTWADQAKAYYIAEQLGVLETIHPALLKAIHTDKRKFDDEYSVLNFFMEQGIDREDFIKAYNSPELVEKVNYARAMSVEYGLRGVPAMIVNGKYRTAPFYLSHQDNVLDVVNFLVAKEIKLINK